MSALIKQRKIDPLQNTMMKDCDTQQGCLFTVFGPYYGKSRLSYGHTVYGINRNLGEIFKSLDFDYI